MVWLGACFRSACPASGVEAHHWLWGAILGAEGGQQHNTQIGHSPPLHAVGASSSVSVHQSYQDTGSLMCCTGWISNIHAFRWGPSLPNSKSSAVYLTIQVDLKSWFPASFLLLAPIVPLFLEKNRLSSQVNYKMFVWLKELKSGFQIQLAFACLVLEVAMLLKNDVVCDANHMTINSAEESVWIHFQPVLIIG